MVAPDTDKNKLYFATIMMNYKKFIVNENPDRVINSTDRKAQNELNNTYRNHLKSLQTRCIKYVLLQAGTSNGNNIRSAKNLNTRYGIIGVITSCKNSNIFKGLEYGFYNIFANVVQFIRSS